MYLKDKTRGTPQTLNSQVSNSLESMDHRLRTADLFEIRSNFYYTFIYALRPAQKRKLLYTSFYLEPWLLWNDPVVFTRLTVDYRVTRIVYYSL